MSYFAPYLDESGIHIPTYADVMEYLISGYKQIFGQDIYIGEDTQDYQLMSLYAKAWDDLQAIILDTYNARNPMWATGTALDLLLPMFGLKRRTATRSTVVLDVTGTPGTTLQSGSIARDKHDNQWKTVAAVTFNASGKAQAEAECIASGEVRADANTIVYIDTPALNWKSVSNSSPAIPGRELESDAEARARIKRSVAIPGRATLESIEDALVNTPGVTEISVLENNTSSVDSNGIKAHSICAVVDGGSSKDIAKTIFLKKAPGIGTYGKASDTYIDRYGNSNRVWFSRPTKKQVSVRVIIERRDGWDAAMMEAKMKEAVAEYINGLKIGEPLYISALHGPCYQANIGDSLTFVIYEIAASIPDLIVDRIVPVAYDDKLVCNKDDVFVDYRDSTDSIP